MSLTATTAILNSVQSRIKHLSDNVMALHDDHVMHRPDDSYEYAFMCDDEIADGVVGRVRDWLEDDYTISVRRDGNTKVLVVTPKESK